MITHKCPHCAAGMIEERSYAKAVKMGRRTAHVDGLRKMVCANCSGEVVTREQFKANQQAVTAAISEANTAQVDAEFLRTLRERFQLSQRTASQLIGAGDSAFGKWESGQTAISTPAALLLRCAAEVPGVTEFLADLAGVTLEAPLRDDTSAIPVEAAVTEVSYSPYSQQKTVAPRLEVIRGLAPATAQERDARYFPIPYRGSKVNEVSIKQ